MVSCIIDDISMTDILISWKVQRKCIRLYLSSSDMSLVHLCKVLWFLCHFTWRWKSWSPCCLIDALSIYCSLQLCRRTDVSPLFLDLLFRSFFLSTRPCIHRVYVLFPHFCLFCICYDILCFDIMVMLFSTSSHKKTKSALEKLLPLRLFCMSLRRRVGGGHINLPLSVLPS